MASITHISAFLAAHRRERYLAQLVLVAAGLMVLLTGPLLRLPGWLGLLALGLWLIVSSLDALLMPGRGPRRPLRLLSGLVFLLVGLWGVVLAVSFAVR